MPTAIALFFVGWVFRSAHNADHRAADIIVGNLNMLGSVNVNDAVTYLIRVELSAGRRRALVNGAVDYFAVIELYLNIDKVLCIYP